MNAHTPGPWILRESGKYGDARAWLDTRTDNSLVELRAVTPEGRLDFTANARLIAAAPEMLEALRLTLEAAEQLYKYLPSTRAFEAVSAARAAIAKAEGREP